MSRDSEIVILTGGFNAQFGKTGASKPCFNGFWIRLTITVIHFLSFLQAIVHICLVLIYGIAGGAQLCESNWPHDPHVPLFTCHVQLHHTFCTNLSPDHVPSESCRSMKTVSTKEERKNSTSSSPHASCSIFNLRVFGYPSRSTFILCYNPVIQTEIEDWFRGLCS